MSKTIIKKVIAVIMVISCIAGIAMNSSASTTNATSASWSLVETGTNYGNSNPQYRYLTYGNTYRAKLKTISSNYSDASVTVSLAAVNDSTGVVTNKGGVVLYTAGSVANMGYTIHSYETARFKCKLNVGSGYAGSSTGTVSKIS